MDNTHNMRKEVDIVEIILLLWSILVINLLSSVPSRMLPVLI